MKEAEVIKLAARIGADAAMKKLEDERRRERSERADKRLHNTKLLLRNYRMFREHAENAVYDAAQVEQDESALEIIEDLMMPGRDGTLFVESVKRSVARTVIVVRHIETMLQLYRIYCQELGSPEEERRWRIIEALYINEHRTSVQALADAEMVTTRTIYRDIDAACETIAAYIFGIDGLQKKP